MQRLQDRVVVVTGAGSGLGLASARRMAAEGARIVAVDIDEAAAAAAAKETGGEFVVVLDADSGHLIWYVQQNPHDVLCVRAAVAGADVDQSQLRVVVDRIPGRAAAAPFPPFTAPGFGGHGHHAV